jgi:molybdopterin molybdotransferase
VRNTGNQSSGMLSSVVAANCFIVLARDQGDVEEGTEVQVLPFSGALAG